MGVLGGLGGVSSVLLTYSHELVCLYANTGITTIYKHKKPSQVGPYPSDLDERGCNINGKTFPVVPITVLRPEKAKCIYLLKFVENCKIEICCANYKLLYTHLLYSLMFDESPVQLNMEAPNLPVGSALRKCTVQQAIVVRSSLQPDGQIT
jgi:hypothetical protein